MAGKIPTEKIKQLQDAFNQFSDKRGLVKTRNIERVLKHMGESPGKEEVQDMINQVDVDGAGVCRFPDFLHMMAKRVGFHKNIISRITCFVLLRYQSLPLRKR